MIAHIGFFQDFKRCKTPDFSLSPLFSRIEAELVNEKTSKGESSTEEPTEKVRDNSSAVSSTYKLAAEDTFGDKAAIDLIKTKGKGFRKEKAKKKRATWKGNGCISFQTQSVRLDSEAVVQIERLRRSSREVVHSPLKSEFHIFATRRKGGAVGDESIVNDHIRSAECVESILRVLGGFQPQHARPNAKDPER